MTILGRFSAISILVLSLIPISLAQTSISKIQKKALLNGFEIYFLPPLHQDVSQFTLMIKNGAAFDPTGKWGVTNLMIRMLLNGGSKKFSPEHIKQNFEAMDVRIQNRVEWDAVFISGKVPTSQLSNTLSILAEIIVNPDFTEEKFQQEKKLLLQEFQLQHNLHDSTQSVFRRKLFGPNPYARAVKGTIESIANLSLVDVKIQYRKLIMPNQAQLALYYDDFDNRLFLSMGRPWGRWVRSEPAPFTFRKASVSTDKRIVLIDSVASKSVIRVGGLTIAKSDRSYYPFKVLEHYLTLSLPDWAREIENSNQIRGSVSFSSMHMPGDFQITLQVEHSHVGDYLRKCLNTLDHLAAGEINLKRYQEAKELAFLALKQRLENPKEQLVELLEANLYGLGISYLVNFGLRLDRVQPHQFSEMIARYLKEDSLIIVVSGPAPKISESLSQFGPFQLLK